MYNALYFCVDCCTCVYMEATTFCVLDVQKRTSECYSRWEEERELAGRELRC